MFAVFDPRDTSFFIYCKSSIKRLRGWACSHAQTCRHLIGPTCMRQKATRRKASGAIVECMGAIVRVRPKPHGAIDFYSLGGGSLLCRMREAARSLFTHMAVIRRPGHDPGYILSGSLLIISFMSAGLNAMAPGQEPDNIYAGTVTPSRGREKHNSRGSV